MVWAGVHGEVVMKNLAASRADLSLTFLGEKKHFVSHSVSLAPDSTAPILSWNCSSVVAGLE